MLQQVLVEKEEVNQASLVSVGRVVIERERRAKDSMRKRVGRTDESLTKLKAMCCELKVSRPITLSLRESVCYRPLPLLISSHVVLEVVPWMVSYRESPSAEDGSLDCVVGTLQLQTCRSLVVIQLTNCLTSDAAGELNVLHHEGDSLGVQRTEIAVLEDARQVGLGSFLQSKESLR